MNKSSQIEKLLEIQKSLLEIKDAHKVLIVDDDRLDADITARKISAAGVECVWEHDGKLAIELVSGGAFKLVFLDWKLVGQSGIDTLIGIKRLHTKTIVIVLTGWATDEISSAAFSAGAAAIMPKPITDEQIKLIFGIP